jgi:hypothetical protein
MTPSERKAVKKAERAEKKIKREAAKGEVMEARLRTGIGFAAAYIGTQALPSLIPNLPDGAQGTIDFLLGASGAYFAFTDDGPLGDFATGWGMVGAVQTLDNVGSKLTEWFQSAQAA